MADWVEGPVVVEAWAVSVATEELAAAWGCLVGAARAAAAEENSFSDRSRRNPIQAGKHYTRRQTHRRHTASRYCRRTRCCTCMRVQQAAVAATCKGESIHSAFVMHTSHMLPCCKFAVKRIILCCGST